MEVGWRKSSFSPNNGGNCVEVGTTAETVAIRDSKHVPGPILTVPASDWAGFLRTL
ncbi:DUF397 domain-containing protein [Phytomonospora sp. NPDC050363]|uniref:DUF397 domain-containing protein n=1 Tax=Phytomonospora sp. NPDC050363 TaxID=3155642 RepID=UPI0033D00C6E